MEEPGKSFTSSSATKITVRIRVLEGEKVKVLLSFFHDLRPHRVVLLCFVFESFFAATALEFLVAAFPFHAPSHPRHKCRLQCCLLPVSLIQRRFPSQETPSAPKCVSLDTPHASALNIQHNSPYSFDVSILHSLQVIRYAHIVF
jgi:hypothetical protein